MAYVMNFKTLWGNDCEVRITPSGDDGTDKALTAAEEPFEIETDDDTAIDAVVRATTGTLRFIVEEGREDVLDAILPTTLLGTRVETYLTNAETGERVCKFAGYIEITEYSQPWDSAPYEMELPVRDALSLMEDVSVDPKDDSDFGGEHNVAYWLVEAMDAVGIEPSRLIVIDTKEDGDILAQKVQREWFIEESEETDSQGTTKKVSCGKSWQEALEMTLLGMALDTWVEGDTLYIRNRQSGTYYEYKWDDVRDMSEGQEVAGTGGSVDMPRLSSLYEIMSDANTKGYLQPYGRLVVKQSLNDTSLLKIDKEYFSDTKMASGFTHTGGVSGFIWQGTYSQRGLDMARRYVDGNMDISETTLAEGAKGLAPGCTYNGYDIVGGCAVSIGSFDTSSTASQCCFPEPDGIGITTPTPMGANESGTAYIYSGGGGYVFKAECPFVIETIATSDNADESKDCICLTARADHTFGYSGGTFGGIGFPLYDSSMDRSAFVMRLLLRAINTENEREVYEYLPLGYGAPEWSEFTTYSFQSHFLLFDENGSILPNVEETTITVNTLSASTGSPSRTNTQYPEYYLLGSSRCMLYKDSDGYVIPLRDLPKGKRWRIEVSLYSYTLNEDEISSISAAGVFYRNEFYRYYNHTLITLKSLEVKWCPQCVDGTLPAFGDDPSGNYDTSYTELPEDESRVYETGGDGEDLEVELDTWNVDDRKWGNTAQPALPVERWRSFASMLGRMRRTIELNDARQKIDEGVPVMPFELTDSGGYRYYIMTGGTWQAWNEGGRKKFVEIL